MVMSYRIDVNRRRFKVRSTTNIYGGLYSPFRYTMRPQDLYTLSLVCRQTASETKGLVYQANIFGFYNVVCMEHLLECFDAGQCARVTNIAITDYFIDSFPNWNPVQPLFTTFPNLKRIFLVTGKRKESCHEHKAMELFGLDSGDLQDCKVVPIVVLSL